MELIAGTRGSKLALMQNEQVLEGLKSAYPGIKIQTKKIKTTGDKIQHTTLHDIGGKALFVKELEKALVEGEIDFAVHSMKDVPGELYEGFEIFTVLDRTEHRDVLIAKNGHDLHSLPMGSTVATSSLRRKAQLLALRDDLNVVPIRGNINTRLKKFHESKEIDALILAKAGIERLALPVEISQVISEDIIMPCVGQGALGIEVLASNEDLKGKLKKIQNEKVEKCVEGERAFLQRLGGSCHVPVGAHAFFLDEETITISGVVASLDGRKVLKETLTDSISNTTPIKLGKNLAQNLLDRGAALILEEIEQGVE